MVISEKQLEVTLLGTGGGYGESIVRKLGNNDWIIVDSCIDPFTKSCLPLDFLQSKGVNIKEDVKLIVCTHWHDDHIRGISKLLSESLSAKFCMAPSNDTKKFLLLVGLDCNKSKYETSLASTIEISKCFEIINSRGANLIRAVQDKLIYYSNSNEIESKILALSPSDFILNEYDKEISSLITEYGNVNSKIVFQSPNDKSVALLVSVNSQNILLGSDLEFSEDPRKGWLCILDNCNSIKGKKASLFKIPHHGSSSSYHERIWNELLIENPVAKLTPWNLGRKLPKSEMIDVFLSHSHKLFITSGSTLFDSPKKRDKSLAKAIKKFNPTLQEVKYKFGQISCHLNLNQIWDGWQINLSGTAYQFERKSNS